MATKLTDIAVEAWKPDPAKRLEIGDALVPGLFLVVQPSGKKSWAVRYRHMGQPKKLTLGPVSMIRLAAAREAARDKLQAVARGEDPAADKQAAKSLAPMPAEEPTAGRLWWDMVDDFNKIELASLRSGAQTYRALERETKERWKGRAAADITKRDVQALVDEIKSGVGRTRGPAPVQANRTLSYVSWAFSWGMRRDYVTANPCANVDKATSEYERRRDRVLDDAELADVWRAADELGHPFGPMVHMLILTGTRLREVAEAEWAEFDLERRLWTIPPARAKNGEAHRVHLTEPTLAILNKLPRIGEKPRYVFTTTGETPISGFDRAKRRIDAELAKVDAARQERGDVFAPRQPWVFHDLRRSVASGLARLKVPFEVVERILAHRGESNSGLRAVYNRHSYETEKREALTAWADHLAGLQRPAETNVTPLRRGKV